MTEVQNIRIGSIDPESTVNVRRTAVGDNVRRVKRSIEEHGYWPDSPIVVRPHPDPSSEYGYEYVVGQCRLKASLELGLEDIPALVVDLTDDQAIQRSWLENEARADLAMSDRTYWTERIYKKYAGAGYTGTEAFKLAADFLGVEIGTVLNYYGLAALPSDVMEMIDQNILRRAEGNAIVKYTYDAQHFPRSQDAMRKRAQWMSGLDRHRRAQYAKKALEELGHKASIGELDAWVQRMVDQEARTIEVRVPEALYPALLEWGKQRGISDPATILSHMLSATLKRLR